MFTNQRFKGRSVTYLIALVWILFALLGKLLPVTPSHQLIVARVFGDPMSLMLVRTIAFGELLVAIWIVSGVKRRWCGIFQITTVGTMNCIEQIVAHDLLLWGWFNALFAGIFMGIVYINMVASEQET